LDERSLTDSDRKEFVSNDRFEAEQAGRNDGQIIFNDLLHKCDFIRTFQAVIPRLALHGGERVLEMGASHGWACAMLKAQFPSCYLVASDLVPETVAYTERYERLLGCRVDEKWAFNCRDIPFADAQFDCIFTFASFHHFGANGDYAPALAEMTRVLRPGGRIVLLYEPSSPAYLYKRAFKRVNRNRSHEGVDEDVLVLGKLEPIVRRLGCAFHAEPMPFYRFRSSLPASNYYFLLSKLGPLSRAFVTTVNVTIEKPAGTES
jgi:SAM-dependent methyltransferase